MTDTSEGAGSGPPGPEGRKGEHTAELDPRDPERRDFIGKITGAVAGAGIATAAWPFISSMNPSRDVIARASARVSLKAIGEGESRTVEWRGQPVFLLHRTPEQIERMQSSEGSRIDPQPDKARTTEPKWLVVVGICTHLGCVPTREEYGWFCPCHGSRYDNSGRVLKGPAPRNLDVPPYRFVSGDEILIGETETNGNGDDEAKRG